MQKKKKKERKKKKQQQQQQLYNPILPSLQLSCKAFYILLACSNMPDYTHLKQLNKFTE